MKTKVLLLSFIAVLLFIPAAYAQYNEPEVQRVLQPRNLYNEGFRTGAGLNAFINDFGFGVGGHLRKGVSPYTELTFTLRIAGLRDPSEQTFIGFFGQQTIPNKYKRAMVFPALIGVKRRLFPAKLSDNFRVYTELKAGPALAFTYPYFDDRNNNGFRENFVDNFERINDIFTGWSQGETQWGWNGELTMGIDFGDNFAKLSSFQFGYIFYYFQNGIQMIEPFRPNLDANGNLQPDPETGFVLLEPNTGPRKYFGSAQISFTFGGMW